MHTSTTMTFSLECPIKTCIEKSCIEQSMNVLFFRMPILYDLRFQQYTVLPIKRMYDDDDDKQ